MASEPTETAPTDGAQPVSPASPDASTASAESEPAVAQAPTLESVTAERDAAQEQAQKYLEMAQRAQADLQNFRRRAEQERAEAFERGRGEVLLQVLPVLDDFERAMQALPAERREEDWVQGLALIERKLRSALESTGLERIAAEGQPFDPWEHEAILHEERTDVAPGTVATVARPGYRLGGRVLRPAQVVVAKEP
ncbi:MAG TPA: nucleotide exchange factor GrpE [Chloroflexota bacterium]|nr:nucleotide exchange factor GrpE [Chloroflexota bacterium]